MCFSRNFHEMGLYDRRTLVMQVTSDRTVKYLKCCRDKFDIECLNVLNGTFNMYFKLYVNRFDFS